jgi:glutaredoxin
MKKTDRWMLAVPAAMLFAALPAQALYKVVSPDGKVTYTDTPPPASSGMKVIQLGASNNVIPEAPLPVELRQVAQRFPVTLYTMKQCEPCDSGRTLLRQRGVPFAEKLIVTGDDAEALARVSGSRDAPTLTVGAQVLRGYSADAWGGYLDSAGYPRESKLPATYQYPAATPLTEPPAPVARPAAAPPAPAPAAPVEPPPPATNGGIRF